MDVRPPPGCTCSRQLNPSPMCRAAARSDLRPGDLCVEFCGGSHGSTFFITAGPCRCRAYPDRAHYHYRCDPAGRWTTAVGLFCRGSNMHQHLVVVSPARDS